MTTERPVDILKELLTADIFKALFNIASGDVPGAHLVNGALAGADFVALALDKPGFVPVCLDNLGAIKEL